MSSGRSGPPNATRSTASKSGGIRSAHGRALSSCTASTTAATCATGVSGRTPWPRLKTWPGRPPARSRMRADAPRDLRRGGAKSATGSRLPCTPTPSAEPPPRLAEVDAPVEADHVAAGLAHQLEERAGAGPEVDDRDAGGGERRQRARACAAGRRCGSRRGRGNRPSCRRAAPPRRRPRPAPARSRPIASASRSMSACQATGSPYISVFVCT